MVPFRRDQWPRTIRFATRNDQSMTTTNTPRSGTAAPGVLSDANTAALRIVPVWRISGGPPDESAKCHTIPPTKQVAKGRVVHDDPRRTQSAWLTTEETVDIVVAHNKYAVVVRHRY